ncbi:hypothetical protein U1872_02875 [Sphingomonas sp. RB3P16]|uniref:hypothetical protein n=1 Tax=Parasphingomonas frigoris TaxID=3096163 RepID=UPI002FCC5B33
MTHRDLAWRGLGTGLIVVAAIVRILDASGAHAGLGLLAFLLVVAGLVLIFQGKRVPAALRIERSRHRLLAQAIHDRRRTHSVDRER